ncbi:uncharacterized protein TrAtP1_013336 [Trichoderma atroviride]|uniref:SET domain-containing protein n=1 Tax=Hypocrea atroviridis (strain ATCC 20476 / IMI 206040) TaxID=452589 RepID=G9P6U8_HYPAI|nr:uncharacterized protein TRIATDRAFT_286297 [Trichoderma atroviride IMI 206040]EHK40673.1 hypothetical protein TRIATDRAFT_286297 [Trichoderma atroviride IMI 206040]UKZ62768.1 hypothetical protein TrAtP1_013336 [Trichoderma atroviride]
MEEAPISDEAAAQVGSESLYAIQAVPGKGISLIATTKILKGARILSELPIFKVSYAESNRQVLANHIANKLKDLDEAKQRGFLHLQNVYGLDDGLFLGIARSNVSPLGPGASEGGLFLDAARINHSCRPNAHKSWNENLQRLTVHAVRDIERGQEITISYLGETLSYIERQAILKQRFRFDCGCDLCSATQFQRLKSDSRIRTIQQAHAILIWYKGGAFMLDYEDALTLTRGMLTAFEKEGACDVRFPSVYLTAFQVAIKNGDTARAKIFVERAYAARVLVEGDDSPEAEKVAALVEQPTLHPLYKPSDDVSEVEIPQGVSEAEFEDWLWQQRFPVSEDEDEDEDGL